MNNPQPTLWYYDNSVTRLMKPYYKVLKQVCYRYKHDRAIPFCVVLIQCTLFVIPKVIN